MNDACRELVLRLGKAQVDSMFGRQDKGPIIDDAEFVPLVEAVLTAFETTGIDSQIVEELWNTLFPLRSVLPAGRSVLHASGEHPSDAELSAGTTPDRPKKKMRLDPR